MRAPTQRDRRTALQADSAHEVLTVSIIGILSGLGYLLLYVTQRAIFRNGLVLDVGGAIQVGDPANRSLLQLHMVGYVATSLVLVGLYGWLLIRCRRAQVQSRGALLAAFLFPFLFNLALLFGRPYLSIDIFSYLAHGYLGNQPGRNPYIQAAAEVAGSDFGNSLAAFGWLPVHPQSPYGPLWTRLEIAVLGLTEDIPTAVLLLKTLVVAASLAAAALIWTILGRVRPRDQLLGTLCYLWNPLIIVEFAAEGHNDAVMIMFVLAALALAITARPGWSVLALLLGVLSKYLPLVLLPALLIYLWRQRPSWQQLSTRLLIGLAAGVCIAAMLYAPLWAGAATFQGAIMAGQPFETASLPGAILRLLARSHGIDMATRLTSLILGGIFALFVLLMSWRIRSADALLSACATIVLVYLLVVSAGYWPWYAALPVALLALTPRPMLLSMILVLTICSRLAAPVADLVVNGYLIWPQALLLITGIGVTVPLIVGIGLLLWRWGRLRVAVQPGVS